MEGTPWIMERVRLCRNLGEREKMFHVGNGNGKGLQMGMYSMVQNSKKTCGDGEE